MYCENCVHYEECEQRKKALGIITYVKGKVDCEHYYEKESEDDKQNGKQE